MRFLPAPWRWNFISKTGKLKECVFCNAQELPDGESLICFRGKQYFVILNKFPYSTGHLMIVPYEHLSSPNQISPGDSTEMWDLMNRSLTILKEKFNPGGFNMGMNIGKCAGAGVKDHFHLHIVPRWEGDANFMAVTGDTKVLSYSIDEVLKTLRKEFNP